jgi:hypothetical protein
MKSWTSVGSVLVVVAVFSLASCMPEPTPAPATDEPPSSSALIRAEPWPEADALFRSNSKWLGSDDAYSVDLGKGRTLWLFGDTFISRSFLNTRSLSTMIRNSVAIQSGYDPSTASIEFYWRTKNGKPLSFFSEDNDTWFWPGHGIALEDKLLIFLMATRSASEGIGFENVGWRAVSISNPEQPPAEWDIKWLDTPENSFGLVVSGSVIQVGEYVLAFSVKEPEHTIHLVRWPVAQVMNEDLSQPQWWAGQGNGWATQQDLVEKPQALFSEGHNEFTVHYEPLLEQYLEIQTVGFGRSDLGYRLSDSPVGTWAPIEGFYRPEEYQIPDILIYAAKAHPHLDGASLVLTYATNIVGYGQLVARDDLYYPRFLRAGFDDARDESSP